MNNSEKIRKLLNKDVEKQLIPKLNYLGYSLVVFGLVSLCYAFFFSPYPSIKTSENSQSEASFLMNEESSSLNLYVVSGVFFTLGISCMFIAWKRKP
ncbi:MAG TPA: hypothetical protein VLG49_03535 [Rhabdochlamydiaceae bacterium]|nr:hypothetical protein [Rhabdochlamydiaceae bacterium]